MKQLERNSRLVCIPKKYWKSSITHVYEIHLVINKLASTQCKLLVIPYGDKMVISMFSMTRKNIIYSIVEHCFKYFNPHSSNKLESYMNLKEISRRFKDYVATPLRTDVLLDLGLTNPSYMGLPLELKMKIQDMTK
ncbi:uncharacterized protein LOC109858922 isoform X2 [Pseudomyrmex gracilis]|uniref:uncharacterized protein LOC109858922 isoform X2 n=1 Tax=Pseudomyrmex gracilis TaxID=219809 RepID=UPI0009953B31|nr:uncharacterized protein LOC109858922 isoform X2 [Pseudomyrmex gracilis]